MIKGFKIEFHGRYDDEAISVNMLDKINDQMADLLDDICELGLDYIGTADLKMPDPEEE